MTYEDSQQMMKELWGLYKKYYGPHDTHNDQLWNEIFDSFIGVSRKYPGKLSQGFVSAMISDIDERSRENET